MAVTTQWLDSDGVVSVVTVDNNCWQHSDYTVTMLTAVNNSDYTVITV